MKIIMYIEFNIQIKEWQLFFLSFFLSFLILWKSIYSHENQWQYSNLLFSVFSGFAWLSLRYFPFVFNVVFTMSDQLGLSVSVKMISVWLTSKIIGGMSSFVLSNLLPCIRCLRQWLFNHPVTLFKMSSHHGWHLNHPVTLYW